MVQVPTDLDQVLDDAWSHARKVPGFLSEDEARFLGILQACSPGTGATVEIGSFKGKSTVMLARIAKHYGQAPIISIDPHGYNNSELALYKTKATSSTWEDFLENLRVNGVSDCVKPYRDYSSNLAAAWDTPIRFLWIDGDHSYKGAKADFDGFFPHVIPGGMLAFHDALHAFTGPVRVFVEDVLRNDRFGAAGFVGSLAWTQFRPEDGDIFNKQRAAVERSAAPLLSHLRDDGKLRGLSKLLFKLKRARVPRARLQLETWTKLVNSGNLK